MKKIDTSKLKKIDVSKFAKLLLDNIDKIGKLSRLYRILISLGIFAVLIGPFIYFIYKPKLEKINELNKEYETLETKLVKFQNKARQLKKWKAKMEEAKEEFYVVKKKLPEKKDIPSLLASISRSGQDAGLEFLLFKPNPERNKEFYAEIPVSIKVTGSYHNVALFFDKVSRLSRIVNFDDIKMVNTKKKGDILTTSCTAITYRFIETKPQKSKKKKGKKRA
jgi:type IV pilus assembly protein PilO